MGGLGCAIHGCPNECPWNHRNHRQSVPMGMDSPGGRNVSPHPPMCQNGIPPQGMAYLYSGRTPEAKKGLLTT